jgi:lipopolysaccharide transport system ATP-binding protein
VIARHASRAAHALTRNGRSRPERSPREFWALQDVSFEVRRGETVGVIGHNGAGKSTLLKILSRIAEPTSGRASIRGRVGSLLEVGTGFHPELTGRENVFLNGAILGMARHDIARRFDEIVAFADVERFVDTQVKHYSSGMALRLAFAVAAHLEPEILLVDEVLAVGDAAFQRKCLGKMEDVAAGGRTVLFVSHNLSAIKELSQTSLVLSRGRVAFRGSIVEGISQYTREVVATNTAAATGGGWSHLTPHGVEADAGWAIRPGEPFTLSARLTLCDPTVNGKVFFLLHDASGAMVVHNRIEVASLGATTLDGATHRFSLTIPPLWLAPGLYAVHLKFMGLTSSGDAVKHLSERQLLDVRGWTESTSKGLLTPECRWGIEPELSRGA